MGAVASVSKSDVLRPKLCEYAEDVIRGRELIVRSDLTKFYRARGTQLGSDFAHRDLNAAMAFILLDGFAQNPAV